MATGIKITLSAADIFQVRHRARRLGISINEFCRREIQKGLVGVVAEMPEAVIDKVERGDTGRAIGAYLSGPLAKAVATLASESQRSQSWIVRDLLRTELRRRGLLPTPANETVSA